MGFGWDEDKDMGVLVVPKKMLLEAQSKPFDSKKNCFVPDEKEGFLPAEVVGTKGEELTVQLEKGEVRAARLLYSSNIMKNRCL